MTYSGNRELDSLIEELQPVNDRTEAFEPVLTFRRRTVIRYTSLCEPDSVIPVNELAPVCAAVERDTPVNDLRNSDYNHIRQGLKDRDFPLLASHDVIGVIDETKIRRGERFGYYIDLIKETDSFARVYETGEA